MRKAFGVNIEVTWNEQTTVTSDYNCLEIARLICDHGR